MGGKEPKDPRLGWKFLSSHWRSFMRLSHLHVESTRETRHNPGAGTQKHGYVDEAVDGSNPTHRDEDAAVDLCIDPRHRKLMRPHQTEGFRFLVKI
ncbi:hypothetical protein HPP92_022061 [Vanilla planifolia]|uniref:Uncharacterized protein n=1 Tax=Vanilla planifolia TaxID=51239 RepID=A0A835UF29_VANPL|nr:hypothetical protein HPP92_022061 [Vanilla planifolia]